MIKDPVPGSRRGLCIIPVVDAPLTIDDQFPDEERKAPDQIIAPEDDALLGAGSSPEFDHDFASGKRHLNRSLLCTISTKWPVPSGNLVFLYVEGRC